MITTWYLVADRSMARIYETNGLMSSLHRVDEIPPPSGCLQSGDINSDRPGRAQDSHGPHRHGLAREVSPTEHLALEFAKIIAEKLHAAQLGKRYSRLVLVAGPKFLGKIRVALYPSTARLVVASLDKDLEEIPDADLPQHLASINSGIE